MNFEWPPFTRELAPNVIHTPAIKGAKLALICALICALCACTTVAGTGRKQFNVYSVSEEHDLGARAYQQEMKQAKLVERGPIFDRVQAVGERISAAAKRRHPSIANTMLWKWSVLDEPKMINAWMLPGGYGAVYTGLVQFAQSDDELAIVMGHEAAHAIARHGGERMSQAAAAQLGAAAIGASTNSEALAEGAAMGLQAGILLPYSRKHESEADELGLLIAAQAGFDPRSAIALWKRMQAQGGSTVEFLSTHPSEDTRIKLLQEHMPHAYDIYKEAQLDRGSSDGLKASKPKPTP